MKKSIMLVCCIISIIMSACSAKEESISEKVHKSENLVKDSCYLLDDNVYADYYEQINGYFFLSGSEQLLLRVV